jgi:hypothetical protein
VSANDTTAVLGPPIVDPIADRGPVAPTDDGGPTRPQPVAAPSALAGPTQPVPMTTLDTADIDTGQHSARHATQIADALAPSNDTTVVGSIPAIAPRTDTAPRADAAPRTDAAPSAETAPRTDTAADPRARFNDAPPHTSGPPPEAADRYAPLTDRQEALAPETDATPDSTGSESEGLTVAALDEAFLRGAAQEDEVAARFARVLDDLERQPERRRATRVRQSHPPTAGSPRYASQVRRPPTRGMVAAVIAAVVFLLVILPGVLVLRGASHDAAFDALDRVHVPAWAAANPQDRTSGDQWCLSQCRKSDRIAQSTKPVDQTAAAYAAALRAAGWTPAAAGACPKSAVSCWVLDANELTVTLGVAPCAREAQPTNEALAPDPTATDLRRVTPPAGCAQTTVIVSIFDRAALQRG